MNLNQLANFLAGSPLNPLVHAQLVKIAAATVKDDAASDARQMWALNILRSPAQNLDPAAVALVISNPTIAATLAGDGLPNDSDLEYVIVNEVLPHIAPA